MCTAAAASVSSEGLDVNIDIEYSEMPELRQKVRTSGFLGERIKVLCTNCNTAWRPIHEHYLLIIPSKRNPDLLLVSLASCQPEGRYTNIRDSLSASSFRTKALDQLPLQRFW